MDSQGKVIYIASGRGVSGSASGRKISSYIACWKRMGYDIKAVYGGDLPGGTTSVGEKGYGHLSYYRKWYRRIGILNPLIRSVSEYRDIRHHNAMIDYLKKLCTSFKPDLIWERSTRLHCAGLVVAQSLGIPYVLEWKDHLITYSLSWYHARAVEMEKRKEREANFIVVESNVLREHLANKGVKQDKIIVAHNAVDAAQFTRDERRRSETRRLLGIEDHEILVGYIGSYAFYHDASRLVLAADILRRRKLRNIRVLMIGAGKEYPQARKLARERGLLDSFLVMKPAVSLDKVPGVLSALDIAVLPGSTDIICPIKVQEYMACELATVVPDYPCNREVITDGVTGMLFEPKNETALADKISLLAQNKEMRAQLGWQARQEVLKRFTWEKTWGAALQEVFSRIKRRV